jgi:hypothetical protein
LAVKNDPLIMSSFCDRVAEVLTSHREENGLGGKPNRSVAQDRPNILF